MGRRRHDCNLILIGKVVSVNFPRRQLRVRPETDHPERFVGMRRILLQTRDGRLQGLDADHAELVGSKVLITLSNRHLAEELESAKKARIVVRENERYGLHNDEYYVDDLIGIRVVDTSGRALGRVHAVYRTTANDVYEVRDAQNRELMVPAVEERVLDVDVANGVMTVDSKGLVESSDED